MKRIVGSIAAVVLALSLGVAAYAKATPKQNSGANTGASAQKTTPSKHKNNKRRHKKNKRTGHHKMHKSSKGKSQQKVNKTTPPPK